MKFSDQRIVAQNSAERIECAKAVEYGSSSNTIYTGVEEFEFSSGASYLILKGLAKLSLQEEGIDFHGLKPEDAYRRITELCGEPEDYVPEDWFAKT